MAPSSKLGDRGPALLATVGTGALVTGFLLWLVTIAVSRSQISGNGWSLAGNGALVVPLGVGPALVAGGWAAIILRFRGYGNWLRLGIGATGIGLLFVVLGVLSLVVFGAGGLGAVGSIVFEIASLLWLLACPLIALLLPRTSTAGRRSARWAVAAVVLLALALVAGCQAGAGLIST